MWVTELLKAYGIVDPILENVETEEDDLEGIEKTISSLIEQSLKEGNVAIYRTPGRKFMSAIAMYSGIKKMPDMCITFRSELSANIYLKTIKRKLNIVELTKC